MNSPNVLWIFIEDMNDWFGCYGHQVVTTPNIDQLTKNGVRFDRAYMPAGVCSPSRSAVVTGICKSKISFKKIILSPRNKNIAKKLKKNLEKFILQKIIKK